MLKSEFIPVAFDQWYLRQQQDAEGEFYRKIASQSPRKDFNSTTQGFYITDASGQLQAFNNNRGPRRIREYLQTALREFDPPDAEAIDTTKRDSRFSRDLPAGAVVVRVHGKVLGGYPEPENAWQKIFQGSISRDNLWLLPEEKASLAQGMVPNTMLNRVARFHLVDNTRGEPTMWRKQDIRAMTAEIQKDGSLRGQFHLETPDSKRGYVGRIRGKIEFDNQGELTGLQWVALGEYWGGGRYTPNPPPGKFPYAVAFAFADGTDLADSLPPQGTKGWLDGYYQ